MFQGKNCEPYYMILGEWKMSHNFLISSKNLTTQIFKINKFNICYTSVEL